MPRRRNTFEPADETPVEPVISVDSVKPMDAGDVMNYADEVNAPFAAEPSVSVESLRADYESLAKQCSSHKGDKATLQALMAKKLESHNKWYAEFLRKK